MTNAPLNTATGVAAAFADLQSFSNFVHWTTQVTGGQFVLRQLTKRQHPQFAIRERGGRHRHITHNPTNSPELVFSVIGTVAQNATAGVPFTISTQEATNAGSNITVPGSSNGVTATYGSVTLEVPADRANPVNRHDVDGDGFVTTHSTCCGW